MAKKFDKSTLRDGLAPGEVITDPRYNEYGSGTLMARAAKNGTVTVFVKFRVDGRQSKQVVEKGMVRYFSNGGTVKKLQARASEIVEVAKTSGLTATERARVEKSERRARRNAERTIADLGAEYLAFREENDPYADGVRAARLAIERATAAWGDTHLVDLRRKDGTALMNHVVQEAIRNAQKRNMTLGKYPGHEAAKQARALILPMLDYALDELPEIRTDIFKLWKPGTNGPRRAVMSKDERMRFFEALIEFETPQSNRTGRRHSVAQDTADLLRLTYLCAARKSDWVQAQWQDIDLEKNTWVRPDQKRKQGTEHTQSLTQGAIDILERIRNRRTRPGHEPQPDDYVFPSVTKTGKPHRTSVWSAFQTIKDIAKLDEGKKLDEIITPHALRASRITEWRDEHGWSFQKIAKVMGNTADMVEKVYYRPRMDIENDDIEVASDAELPI